MGKMSRQEAAEILYHKPKGTSIQDYYLGLLRDSLSTSTMNLVIHKENENYSVDGNYRNLMHLAETKVRAYFQRPFHDFDLYIATDDPEVSNYIIAFFLASRTNFRMTDHDKNVHTYQVEMSLFSDKSDMYDSLEKRTSLQHVHDFPVGNQVFDVIDYREIDLFHKQ